MLTNTIGSFLRRLIVRAARLPVIYLLIGTSLVALAYIDNLFPITKWKDIFDLTDKIGLILIGFAFATFVYNFLTLLCRWYEKKYADEHSISTLVVASLRKGLRIIFVLVVLNIVISVIVPSEAYLGIVNNIINTIIIGSLGWLAIQALYTYETMIYQHMLKRTSYERLRAKALYTRTHIIRNIATVLIIIITIAAILMSYSSVRNIGISLLASAGFLTAIIGLSAQKTLISLFSSLQIALSQTIKIGDVVVIENISGIIEEITFTYVTLKLGDRRRLIVPISYFVEKHFENWSHEPDSLRSSVHIYTDFLLPIDPLRAEFHRILETSLLWDKKASKLQVNNLSEKSVEIRMQVSASNADDLADLKAEVRENMLAFIREKYGDFFPKVRLDKS